MHVVEIITSTLGGAGEHLYNVIRYSQNRGVEYTVVGTMEGSVPPRLAALGVQLIDFPIASTISPMADLTGIVRLNRLLHDLRPNVIHTHCAKAGLMGRLAAALGLKVPVIHTPHGFPFVKTSSTARRLFYIALERLGGVLCDRIITVSQKERLDGIKHVAASNKLHTIYNGIPVEDFCSVDDSVRRELRKEFGIPEDGLLIGCVARLTEQKAPHVLVDALGRLVEMGHDAYLVFVGRGELEPSLRQLAQELRVDSRVVFAGWRSDLPRVYRALDVFALSSAWEAFGLVLVEAMASRVPVVASRVDGIPEVVEHGVTGLLAEPGNPDAFAHAIAEIVADSSRRERLVSAGQVVARDRFSAQRMADETIRLYTSLAGGGTHGT